MCQWVKFVSYSIGTYLFQVLSKNFLILMFVFFEDFLMFFFVLYILYSTQSIVKKGDGRTAHLWGIWLLSGIIS